ncbi:unnamed protein product [Caenorhabditis sp. 36 PRJEB53466]|nr:unnamed protein product [Caenorhabditis sp. 36 PRJEB53466]
MKEHAKVPPKLEKIEKTFEDAAFEMLSTVSPIKLPREDIPFESVREIVLNEILRSKKQKQGNRKNMDELLDEMPSSSSSSSHVAADGDASTLLERGTMTDEVETTPRPIAAQLYGGHTRSSSTCSSSTPQESSETKKKPLNYREKRLAEIRQNRLKKYRESAEVVEFKCEESGLAEIFCKFYAELIDEEPAGAATIYFRLVESLDVYFRAKTWESNCPKLLCEFLAEHIIKTCQQLNEYHESRNSSDERRAKECQVQVLLTLHVYVVTEERRYLDEAIHKLRMIYISVGAERLRNFVEESVTDVYWELIGDGLATIYDELCISLPADLQQYDNGLFKMTEADESNLIVKRRNGAANRLEQMLLETSSEYGVGGRIPAVVALAMEAPIVRRSLKRRQQETPQEVLSPQRATRSSSSADYKHFFVEDTPDEKYQKRATKKERKRKRGGEDDDGIEEEEEEEGEEEGEGEEEAGEQTIGEQIEEEVKQTPMAKLRQAAQKQGNRCSKRLSDLVKLSEERAQIPRKARENLDKILERAKAATPLRSVARQTRKSVLFGSAATPTNSPAGMSTRGAARASLIAKFNEKSPATEQKELHFEEETKQVQVPLAVEMLTPTRERGTRRRGAPPARYREAFANAEKMKQPVIKQEIEDEEFDAIEGGQPCSSSSKPTSSVSFLASSSSALSSTSTLTSTSSSSSSNQKWTERQLRRQLGLTREDLNRYREAMLSTGERSRNNKEINWENAQVNRAGRVKGAGASEDGTPIFGIRRKNVRTMICHVLLNDTNPDTNFDWNKVKFDEIGDDKPLTRNLQKLRQNPEVFMESLKQKYIEKKTSPTKKTRCTDNLAAAAAPSSSTATTTKKRRPESVSPTKSSSSSSLKSQKSTEKLDEFGFECETDD